MASTNTVDLSIVMNSKEILDEASAPGSPSANDRTIRQTGYGFNQTLNASSTPAMTTNPSVTTLTMTGSAVTVDLTAAVALAIPASASRTVNFNTKKIIAFQIVPHADNADAVNVAPGASNGYALFGSANDIDLEPGQMIGCVFNGVASTLPTVGSGAKNIDFTGTSGDKVDLLIFA